MADVFKLSMQRFYKIVTLKDLDFSCVAILSNDNNDNNLPTISTNWCDAVLKFINIAIQQGCSCYSIFNQGSPIYCKAIKEGQIPIS
jgi:hypothetical protein